MGARPESGESRMIPRLVRRFLSEHVPGVPGPSPHTLRSYRTALAHYMDYLESMGVTPDGLSGDQFSRERIEGWVAWLKADRGNSNDTCNVRLAALRTFLGYCASREPSMVDVYLASKLVKRQRTDGRKVTGMSREAVAAILAQPDTSTAKGRRDLTFLSVMYCTACRLGELAPITVGQCRLDGAKPHIVVRGKGGVARVCYLQRKGATMLARHIAETLGEHPAPSELVFPSPSTGRPLTGKAWDKTIKRYASMARATCPDVPEDAHCHQLRHAMASHWIEDGVSIVEVQHLLGHKHLSTTMRYLDVTVTEKSDALERLPGTDAGEEKRWKDAGGSLRGVCGLDD